MGTPVLVSEKVGLAEYVVSSKSGWVCSLDIKDITLKLAQAIENKELRASIRERAAEKIRKDFSEENLLVQYKKLYQQVINA